MSDHDWITDHAKTNAIRAKTYGDTLIVETARDAIVLDYVQGATLLTDIIRALTHMTTPMEDHQ